MRRLFLAVAAIAATLFVGGVAMSCPCRGSSGPGAALTGPEELFGASVTQSARIVHGTWDPWGRYAALSEGNSQYLIDVALAAAVRPLPRLELAAEQAIGHQSVAIGSFSSQRTGPGDTFARLRFDALDEPMAYEPGFVYRPALGLVLGVRAPTGTLDRASAARGVASGTTGSVGATAGSQGLGTWELSTAVGASKLYKARYGVDVTGEVAYRFPDDALGVDRHLGPRALGQLTVRYLPGPASGVGLMTDLGWEAPVAYDGVTRQGTGQRIWTVGAFAFLLMRQSGLRSGIMLRYAPPLDGVSVNAVGTTTLSVSLGYSR